MTISIQDIANQMLALLPDDGTPVLNRVMRVMLSRELQTSIDQDRYFEARDILLKKGRVGVQRGQGGQIFYLPEGAPPEAPATAPAPSAAWAEAQLMEPLRKYLEGPFRKGLDLPSGSGSFIHNTSARGDRRGRWARPDFILVTAMKFKLMPGAQVDVHSFELKTETGATDLAVYEALAQTRFTHFGHLVWHLPKDSNAKTKDLLRIEEQCDHHGIGLIRIHDPKDIESFEILLDPRRKATMPATVEGFLDKRLDEDQREQLVAVINGTSS